MGTWCLAPRPVEDPRDGTREGQLWRSDPARGYGRCAGSGTALSLRSGQHERHLSFEPLEDRRLLSVVPAVLADWQAQPTLRLHLLNALDASGSSSPYGLSPNQVRGAYGLGTYASGVLSNGISFGGINGDGTGQTIAIVDVYDDPNAATDLNTFSTYFGLPTFGSSGGPTFEKLNQTGGTSLPVTDPSGPYSSTGANTWEIEESLDIEWAHAMAPMANIILFEATSASNSDLYTAVQTAAKTSGVVAVSMSWSGAEYSGETGDDSYFTTPSGHLGGSATMGGTELAGGVTFLAAAGDSGAYASNTTTISPQYPATSPNVVAVGGTTLNVSGNTWSSETTWGNGTSSGSAGGGGGGISAYESQPSYQKGVVSNYSTTNRTYPDVSADANPNTGVPVCDSWDFGSSTPWFGGYIGGTSLATPLWAGMIAVADQGRATRGLGSLNGATQTLPDLYKLAASDFHDITSGSSTGPSPTYSPATGYDLTSGRGSPVANLLIPQLVGPTQLAFGQPPTSAGAGATISPAVTVLVEDSLGNVVAGDSSSVTLSIANNPGGGTLSGTLTVAAVNGVATFNNLSINLAGSGYTLQASDTTGTGLLTVTSAPFNIATPPTVATPAAANPNPVTGTSTSLSVLGADSAGESTLSYTWAATTLPAGAAAPVFSANGTNAAKNSTATFSEAGTYVLTATITDAGGGSVTSSVSVTVDQTATSVTVAPATVVLASGGTQQFTATVLDQFGAALASQPVFTWSATSGSITSGGLFTAAAAAATVTAEYPLAGGGSLSGAAQVSIDQPPTVATPAAASPATVTGTSTTLSVLGADVAGESTLTYTWTATTVPSGAAQPTYSVNDSNAAKTTTATFSKAGTYVFQATITDAGGFSAYSSVSVTVNQTLASFSIAPGPVVTLSTHSQVQFSTAELDQFGNPMSGTPPPVTWTAASGTITSTGLYTSPSTAGSDTVTAGYPLAGGGSLNGTASVTVVAPVSWWKLNEGSGTTANDSGSGTADPGTITSGTWIEPPSSVDESSALQFNGSSSVVALGDPSKLQFTSQITFSAWINPSNSTSNQLIIDDGSSSSSEVYLGIGGGYYVVGADAGSYVAQYAIPSGDLNTWVQLVGTYDGTTWRLYRDGQLVASTADAGFTLPNGTWDIGAGTFTHRRSGQYLTDYFSGDIGDVRVYSTAISSAAIAGLAAAPPTVTTAAAALPTAVTAKTTVLSASATDDAGASTLIYTWATTGTPPAAVTFSANGTDAASSTTATFTKAGTYNFAVTITNLAGLAATSSVSVTVSQTLTSITVSPGSLGLNAGATQPFTAEAYDQFGAAMATQPAFTWTTNVGTITSPGGVLTASESSVTGTVTAGYTVAGGGTIGGSSAVTVTDHAPTVAVAAAATPNPATGTTAGLSVLGADIDTGEGSLVYTWAATTLPSGAAAPIFTANGSNAAKNATATFSSAGLYGFTVTITDPGGLTATSTVYVTVNQTLTSIVMDPAAVSLNAAATQQFTATALDQFGNALTTQPAFTWTTNVGTISTGGLLTASESSVTGTVTAGYPLAGGGTISGSSTVTVTDNAPTVAQAATTTPNPVTGTTAGLSVLGADVDTGQGSLIYTWTATTLPDGAAAPTFSANGSDAAQNTTATFSAAGLYGFTVTITDPGGLTATSTVYVTVNQTLTGIAMGPAAVSLDAAATQQFTATALDQFGTALAIQPAFTWTTNVGTISTGGLLTASESSVTGTVTAGYPLAGGGTISGSSFVTVTDNAPTVAVAATTTTPNPATGTTSGLSVLGADVDTGEGSLVYTWAATTVPGGAAAPTFSDNGDNTAKNTMATFSAAGLYGFTVTITDPGGLTATSTVYVTVDQTFTGIAVGPASVSLDAAATQQFTATALDQFGTALATQPAFTWTTNVGTISTGGLLTASESSVTGTVTAGYPLAGGGTISGSSFVTVTDNAPTVAVAATTTTPNPATGTTSGLSVLGADVDTGEGSLVYSWAATTLPGGAAAPTFSDNGDNTAKNTTATFSAAGLYGFTVTITDPGGLTAASSVSVTVDQTLTSITVQPTSGLAADGTEPFTVTARDQFSNPLVAQPQFTWSLVGGGSISSAGVFTPPYATGTATVQATSGSVTGSNVVSLPGPAQLNASSTASWDTVSSWTSTASGSTAGNPGLRGVSGDGVVFASAGAVTVNLDGASPSLADVTFSGTGSYTIAQGSGGTLQLDNGASPATLTVSAGSDTISAPVALASNVTVLPAAGSQLTISGGISGAGALAVNDQGTVVLSGANSYSGGTTVTAGKLVLANSSAIADGTSLTVGADASIFSTASSTAAASSVASSGSVGQIANLPHSPLLSFAFCYASQ